jgi:hypothetical protein
MQQADRDKRFNHQFRLLQGSTSPEMGSQVAAVTVGARTYF